jgi:hypothetical protein
VWECGRFSSGSAGSYSGRGSSLECLRSAIFSRSLNYIKDQLSVLCDLLSDYRDEDEFAVDLDRES